MDWQDKEEIKGQLEKECSVVLIAGANGVTNTGVCGKNGHPANGAGEEVVVAAVEMAEAAVAGS